jgi:RNA polymerase sigma-70 factor (ECF subfamily)
MPGNVGTRTLLVPTASWNAGFLSASLRSAARVSDDAEFEAFFLESYGGLHRTLTVIIGDAELAADALQDAYQRAYVRWKKISRYDAPAAWVRHVAINRSRDMIRSNDRRLRNEERAAGPHIVVDEQPDDSLFGLLQSLPERQRTAMALHYLEDLSVEQVADEMGISSGAVKYHLNQGRGKIRPILEKRES